jgi:hypothetical protein
MSAISSARHDDEYRHTGASRPTHTRAPSGANEVGILAGRNKTLLFGNRFN